MMKIAKLSLLLLVVFTSAAVTQVNKNEFHPSVWADPQIGSVHGRWFFYTPASLPFGMARLAPHTNAYGSKGGWEPCGYDDRHTSIEGFGHFHEFQVGGLVVMPTTGALQNCYIQKASLNGKEHNQFSFSHTDFSKGGLLELWLGAQPNLSWGKGVPSSMTKN